ncbi:metallophosphoesterase [uncultured Parabacteroides sp.]|uniref:metallophosphoesterase n=1 Tax=uncultured Parabacteroides sp. TaxID=512312 RepID=UPI002609E18D|nr:metallophosphoesterase [uncultured Parabacteroides sp.]
MNIVESDKKNVVICGDIHGEFETLVYNLKINNITDSLIIVAGDCGFGFHKASYYDILYKRLAPKLRTQGNIIFFVRGNHDDPAYFDGKTFVKKYMRCIADYTVVSVAGHHILCVGGAISIDREPHLREMELNRILRKDKQPLYWKDEAPVFLPDEIKELTQSGIKIDTVVTHTAPDFCEKRSKSGLTEWVKLDSYPLNDIALERLGITSLYDELACNGYSLQKWYYGHFHDSFNIVIDNVNFVMIGVLEMKMLLRT